MPNTEADVVDISSDAYDQRLHFTCARTDCVSYSNPCIRSFGDRKPPCQASLQPRLSVANRIRTHTSRWGKLA